MLNCLSVGFEVRNYGSHILNLRLAIFRRKQFGDTKAVYVHHESVDDVVE
jgi:aminopeptidase-like protein